MTLREKIICTAYTGINFCRDGDDYTEFQKYAEKLMGRPVQTIEMIDKTFWNKLQELSRADFLEMLNGEYEEESDDRPDNTEE